MVRSLVLTFLVLTPLALRAQSAPAGVDFTSPGRVVIDARTGVAVAQGGGRLTYQGALLTADEMSYNQRLGTAVAKGNVRLLTGSRLLLADELTYRLDNKSFTASNLRLGQSPLYMTAQRVTGTDTTYVLEDARISYEKPGPFAPTLTAAKVTYSGDQEVRAERVRLGLGFFQPLVLPTFNRNLNAPFFSLLTATGGYRSSLGAFIVAGLELPVTAKLDVGGQVGLYTNRGVMAGPSASYTLGENGSGGSFRSGYIHDNGDTLTDVLGSAVPKDRGYFEWNHRQRWGDRLTLNGALNYWSDSEIIRDFRRKEFTPVQTPDSYLEGTYTGDNYVLSLITRGQPNPYHRMQQRLPEVRFDLLPTAIGGGIYQRAQVSAAVLREDDIYNPTSLRSDRVDAYYALSRPFTPREWLGIQPVAGGRITHYARATNGRDDYTRELGELGLDTELRASGTYAYKNERWGIDGLRHLITPRLSYRYIPEGDRGRAYIPPIDRRAFSTYLQPLGLGDQRNLDDLRRTNTLRLALDNRLQTRDETYGSRDLVAFNVAADLRFDHDVGERELGSVHTELRLTPAKWLQFDLYQNFVPQDFQVDEFNTGVTLRDGDARSLRLATHYLRGQIQEYVLDYRHRLNEVYQGIVRLHYDDREKRFIEQSYGLRQTLDNLWWIEYEISFFEGPRRESSFSFNVQVDLAVF
ncbi:MAG TPA: LPS assembly protein LptD [Opitutaceae bacterium]